MNPSNRRIPGAVATALVLAFVACGTAAAATAPVPLATVDGDTLTTTDLRMELGVMMAQAPKTVRFEAPAPDQVLRRLIQNQLVIDEGYRMGLDQEFRITNPKADAVRSRCMRALLDSVAGTVPQDDRDKAAWVEARRVKVHAYLEGLRETHHVVVDTVLLRGLDYASTDPAEKKRLRDSDAVIATVPNGNITVAGLSREIRFEAFHGLDNKPDAAVRRDKIFWNNLNERLLTAEIHRSGLDRTPAMQAYAAEVERNLMLEESLNILVKFDFAPTDDEVQAYYEAHLDAFTPAPRIRMESVKLEDEESAKNLRAKALEGAKLTWLAKNMPGVIDGPPPFPEDFFEPRQLGLDPDKVELGLIPEPYGVPGGWVVARIEAIEPVAAPPLADCREEILRKMKAEATQQHMVDIMQRLEDASDIRTLPGAEDAIAKTTAELVAARDAELADAAAAADAPKAAPAE